VLRRQLAARVGVAGPHDTVVALDEERLLANPRVIGADVDDVEVAPLGAGDLRRRLREVGERARFDIGVGIGLRGRIERGGDRGLRASGGDPREPVGSRGADVRADIVVKELRERLRGLVIAGEARQAERDVDPDEPRLVERELLELDARGGALIAGQGP